jgi:uncharacterized protein (DUF58 family)
MLTADELRQLDRLTFGNTSASPATDLAGGRVGRIRGFSTEFQDFRQYQPGDDPRSIEWTVYGRLGQLVTRTYRTSAQLRVHLLVDVSASMSLGVPDKLSCATKVAALLCYAALRTRDAVGLATFRGTIAESFALSDSRSQLFRIFAALSGLTASGRSAIGASLMDYSGLVRGPGLVVVISDFFDPRGALDGLRSLQYRRLTPAIAQIVSDDELDPSVRGDVELVDIETSEAGPLVADAASITEYKAALARHQSVLRDFCDRHGLPSLQIRSSSPFPAMLHACSRAGLFVAQQ